MPLAEAGGRILAEPVHSDVDLPPFEKSAMDGFAVRSADFGDSVGSSGGEVQLRRVGESRAGEPFASGTFEGGRAGDAPGPGSCVEIYTGAELPAACDAVVMVERTRREGEQVWLQGPVSPGQNVNHRGEVLAVGRRVFEAGRRISAVDLAVLAAVGCDPVPAARRPRVSILTTGDELVRARERPGPGQIREGNTLYLAAAAAALGMEVREVGIVGDDPAELETAFGRALEEGDALVTTGGVSMGRYDLVGPALEKLGVAPVLHKVAIKPGKPIWFGLRGSRPVFGLPGNPVSSLLGFEVFVRPSLLRLAGAAPGESAERIRRGRWTGGPTRPGDRQQNLPCSLRQGEDAVAELAPLDWMGSADIVALTAAQAFAVVEPGDVLEPGQLVDYRPLG